MQLSMDTDCAKAPSFLGKSKCVEVVLQSLFLPKHSCHSSRPACTVMYLRATQVRLRPLRAHIFQKKIACCGCSAVCICTYRKVHDHDKTCVHIQKQYFCGPYDYIHMCVHVHMRQANFRFRTACTNHRWTCILSEAKSWLSATHAHVLVMRLSCIWVRN